MPDSCNFDPTRYTSAPHQTEGWLAFHESPEKVFARIADHAAMGDWVPMLESVTVSHPHPVAPGESVVGTTRTITFKGGMVLVEKIVYWNPPFCYAYSAESEHLPLKEYIGLFAIEPEGPDSGRFIFREYFQGLPRVEQAVLPHGMIALGSKALANLGHLVGGTEYGMTAVNRI